jgi:hypothetical protein
MGRPIQKRQIGDGSNRIQVTAAYFTGDGAVTPTSVGNQLYIDRQRSSRKFLVKDEAGTKSEVLTLVGKATPDEGEFSIQCILDDSTVTYVTRLHNRTVSVQEDDDATTLQHLPFTRLTEETDEGQVSNKANIDVQK